MSSASSTAFLIDSTVLSILTTTPFRRPLEGWVPMPIISTPSLVFSPTIAQILVVPISSPTIMLSLLAISLTASLHYIRRKPYYDLAMVRKVKCLYSAEHPVPGLEYLLEGREHDRGYFQHRGRWRFDRQGGLARPAAGRPAYLGYPC